MKYSVNWLSDLVDLKGVTINQLVKQINSKSFEVESLKEGKFHTQQDKVLDIEVASTDRVDIYGHYGFAAELAAIFEKNLLKQISAEKPNLQKRDFDIKIDKNLCRKFTATVFEGVKVSDSPDWMKSRLEAVGLKPINNIVDITNYIMMLTAQPMHAYDADKLEGNILQVRKAKKGEQLITLDEQKRKLNKDDIIIADSNKPVGMGGVMGGLETMVTADTTRVVLEAANFNPVHVRRASWGHDMRTDAASRFEKNLPLEFTNVAVNQAIELFSELAEAKPVSYQEEMSKETAVVKIELPKKYAGRLLGFDIEPDMLEQVFKRLNIQYEKKSGSYVLTPPFWRNDLEISEDVVEEVGRLIGLENIPEVAPGITSNFNQDPLVTAKDSILPVVIGMGFDEVHNYSFVDPDIAGEMGFGQHLRVSNPLSRKQEKLRLSLLPNMTKTVYENSKHQTRVALVEFGNVYKAQETQHFHDQPMLGFGFWEKSLSAEKIFKTLKGKLEALFRAFDLDLSFVQREKMHLFQRLDIVDKNSETVGMIGLHKYKNKTIALTEIDFDYLISHVNKIDTDFKQYSTYPSQSYDLSIIVDNTLAWDDIHKEISEPELVTDVKFIENYKGKQIPEGKKGLVMTVKFQSDERTLTDEETKSVFGEIIQNIEKKFDAKIRD